MINIASAFLLCLLGLPMSPPRLRVDLVFDGRPMPPRLEASAMEELVSIWAAYGVDIQAVNADGEGRDDAIRLSVVLADRQERHIDINALGSILFIDDSPKPTIVMYPNAIATLIAGVRLSDHPASDWPFALRDAVLGRVLGRALAHEIGHFLLRSRQHSVVGLMRARQSVVDLVNADRQSFILSADETKRLRFVTSRSN